MRKRERERERGEGRRGTLKTTMHSATEFTSPISVTFHILNDMIREGQREREGEGEVEGEGEGEVEGEKRSGLVKSIPEVYDTRRTKPSSTIKGEKGRRRGREENVGHTSINNLLRSLYKEHSLFNALRYFFS